MNIIRGGKYGWHLFLFIFLDSMGDCHFFYEKNSLADDGGSSRSHHDYSFFCFVKYRRLSNNAFFSVSFFLSCYYAAKQSRRKLVYMAIAVLTVAFAYTSFQLLVFFDPVWIWMDHRWMLAILLVILCFLFYENIQSRLLCLVIGSCQGEMLYSIISQKISFSYIIGSYSFLDTLSLSACCTFIWALVDYIPVYIDGKKPIRGTRQP